MRDIILKNAKNLFLVLKMKQTLTFGVFKFLMKGLHETDIVFQINMENQKAKYK